MTYKVRFVNPQKQYSDHKKEYLETIDRCLINGDLLLRQELKDFEKHAADFIGVKYAIGVNSGHHALLCACIAAGFGPGDEVIVPAHTYMASISAIVQTGAIPVLADAKDDFNIDENQIEQLITPKTKGIMPVHLNGRLCDMEKIMAIAEKHNLRVIEDAAQAFGAKMQMANGEWKKAASFGLAGCLSYYPFKTLGGFSDGGMVFTDDPKVARTATLLRWDGEDRETREFHMFGYTASLSNIWAAILDIKLTKYIPLWLERRREIAELYHEGLKDVPQVKIPKFNDERFYDVYQNYVIRAERRDELKKYFDDNQLVETLISWPRPTYTEPIMLETKSRWRLGDQNITSLPETEKICNEVISLPMYPELTQEQIQYTISCVKKFYRR
jgi:dTDP-4-amino-4,6-dideoxygalactose transaminase